MLNPISGAVAPVAVAVRKRTREQQIFLEYFSPRVLDLFFATTRKRF